MGTVRGSWVRGGCLLAVLVAATVAALTVDLPGVTDVRSRLDDAGAPGLVVLTALVALALLTPVPRTALSVLLGVVLGFWAGLAVALVGGLLGGLAAFGLSRALGRDAVGRLAGRRLAGVDRVLTDRGFGAVLLLRLTPVPFAVGSYAAGLTAVRLLPYAAGTVLGILPGSAVQTAVGASVGVLPAWATSPTGLVVEGAVLLAVALGSLVWWRRGRRAAPGTPAGRVPEVPPAEPHP